MDSENKNEEMLGAAEIWNAATQKLVKRNRKDFDSCFGHLKADRIDGDTLVLHAPDPIFANWISTLRIDSLHEVLAELKTRIVNCKIEVSPMAEEVTIDIEDCATAESSLDEPVRTGKPNAVVNPHHPTFENFVWSEENRYSYMAALTAAEAPGTYNPLYIYGGSGVGKSHLLHAIEHYVRANFAKSRVRYCACSDLLNEFYDLLVNKKDLRQFRSSMRDVDILLLDDVHVLADKIHLQEEIFGVFNTLYGKHKQIVFTSDRQPCEITGLQPRLVNRFESGLTIDIAVPGFEGRLAILKMLRADNPGGIQLSDVVLEFLAKHISSSVRRLKGAFVLLNARASMSGECDLTVEQAMNILHAQLAQENSAKVCTIEDILREVTKFFSVKLSDILSERRPKNIAEPRMVAMYLCRLLTKHSLNEIGSVFGKNHATIINAVRKVPELCSKNESIRLAVMQLERILKG